MPTEIEFGNIDAARKIRNNPQYKAFLADDDIPQSKTVTLKDATPQSALDDITAEAADSKRHEADKAGQADLSRKEREQIDFSREGVNVPKVRSIKAIAGNVGVSDYLSYADLELTVDENRSLLKEAAKEEQGRRDLGRDDLSDARVDQRLANAYDNQRQEQIPQAKDFALIETDDEAQSFVQERAAFDIGFTRRGNRIVGQGEDFERLEERHEQRSERAQTMDEKRSAKKTRDPVQWANNPAKYDYPGIDTVQPRELHEQRSERAQEVDESELAPAADTKEQWALNQDEYDWPGVDTPPAMGLGPNEEGPTEDLDVSNNSENESVFPMAAAGGSMMDAFKAELSGRGVSLAPEEAIEGVGLGKPSAPGGQAYNAILGRPVETDRPEQEQKPPEEALQDQTGGIEANFTDDRADDGQLTDFGMDTDATQHRDSRTEGEKASEFGVDDRDDASRGAENDTDSGDQGGLERFGGGVRENETLF